MWFPLALLSLISAVFGDPFTSVQEMETLARHENKLIEILQEYVQQEYKSTLLTLKLKQLSSARPPAQSPEEYVQNPLNAFSLIRRLAQEWPIILHLMGDKNEFSDKLLDLPQLKVNMSDAVRTLARLQYVYNLNSAQLARGNLGGRLKDKRSHSVMTASDCFLMGEYWYKQKKYHIARTWFHQALRKTEREEDLTVQRKHVLAHLYLASIFDGCERNEKITQTDELLQHLTAEYPGFKTSGELSADYEQALARNCSWVKKPINRDSVNYSMMRENEDNIYNQGCQGVGMIQQRLRCHYVHYNNPRLLLGPFKLEELYLDPPIVMFHNVISDQEIEDMKTAFLDVMLPCYTVLEDRVEETIYRTCNSGWIGDTPTAETLTRRVGDMTDFNMETNELGQVISYGLGGEFMLHWDFFEDGSLIFNNAFGNRMATFMFYLNDVVSGGATVFPYIRMLVTPRKGSAILWFNLDGYGEKLDSLLHGSCPVLVGSKWLLTAWIHEGGQFNCAKDEPFPKKYFYLNNKNN